MISKLEEINMLELIDRLSSILSYDIVLLMQPYLFVHIKFCWFLEPSNISAPANATDESFVTPDLLPEL